MTKGLTRSILRGEDPEKELLQVYLEMGTIDSIFNSDDYLLAKVIRGGINNFITLIQIWGDPTSKPDEGDGAVEGTMQWALDLLVAQQDGGEIWLMGGGDYEFETTLSNSGIWNGVHIRGMYGDRSTDYVIRPATGSNLTWLWDFDGDVQQRTDLIIDGCMFDGQGLVGNTSGGIHWGNCNASKFMNNRVQNFKGVSVSWGATAGSSVSNWLLNNYIVQCGNKCFELTGSLSNTDHAFSGNTYGGSASMATTEVMFDMGTRGGGSRFSNEHLVGPYHGGGYLFDTSLLTLANVYLDSISGTYADISGQQMSFHNMTIYNAGIPTVTPNVFVVQGDHNIISNVQVLDPNGSDQIVNAVQLQGDNNIVENLNCEGITGDAILIDSGSIGNKIGLLNGTVTAITNNSDSSNVQVDTTSIA